MKEERYELTFKGWLNNKVTDVDRLLDELKVFMYETERNAIVLDKGTFMFVKAEEHKTKKVKKNGKQI